ncbi:MAG: efflux RND transporter periplasmic adaptor subunit [Chitinophagaceae bacterium]|nr:efflux RND transporter periplasmic adaptor subunit [Chitinophagaceae bacterium]
MCYKGHFAVILSLSLFLSACSNGDQKKKKTIAEVPVLELTYTDTSLSHNYVADIQSLANVELRARVQGFMEKILIDEGQFVQKGQILFRISPKDYAVSLNKAKAAVAGAEADYNIARLEQERIATMVERKVIAPSEQELGKAKVAAAKAALSAAIANEEEARNKLSYTEVRAPFDGVVDRIPMKVGSLISEGTLLTSLSDNTSIYAYFSVSENEYLQHLKKAEGGRLSQERKACLILADGTPYECEGVIETQEGEFNAGTGSINFRAKFPNPKHLLKHGASGKVHLTSDIDHAVLVPQKSVFEIQDKSYVFLLDEHNKVSMHSFVPRARIEQYYIVKSGLSAGDRIVYEGIQNIRDGVEVKPLPVRAAQHHVAVQR